MSRHNRQRRLLPPSQRRQQQQDADVILVAESEGKNLIFGDPDLADLQGYSREMRSTWWTAYHQGMPNPHVVAIHKRSQLARDRGLTDGPDFTFIAVEEADAVRDGWLSQPFDQPNRPPTMGVFLASGDTVQVHLITDMTITGIIDKAHFDPVFRAKMMSDHPELIECPYFDQPWEY